MRSPKLLIVIVLLCYSYTSIQAQPAYLLHKTYAERYVAIDTMYEGLSSKDTATVIAKLSELENWAANEQDKELQYSFIIIKYRYLINKRGKNNAEVQNNLPKLVDELGKDKQYLLLQVQAMNTLAEYYWNDYSTSGLGFDYALKAYDIYGTVSAKDFPPKSFYLFNLGINHMRFKDYQGAKKYFLEAINVRPQYRLPKQYNILNAWGMCYRNTGMYDSAEYLFKQAYDAAPEKDSLWRAIITGNIGITYYFQQRYTEAIPLLERDIHMSLLRKQTGNAAKSLAILGDIYLIQGDRKKALDLLLQSYDIIKTANRWYDYELLQTVYPKLAKVYAANGDLQMAYGFMDSAMKVKDSLASQKNFVKLATVQQKQEHAKYEAEVQRLAEQKKLHAVIRNSLVGGILLLAVIAILFINRQRLKNLQREQELLNEKRMAEAQQQLAQTELEHASVKLTDFTRSIQEKNQLIEKFSEEIERLQSLPCSVELPDTRENLAKLQQSTILTEQQWEDFRAVFEKVHNGFFIRLREKLPDLSPAEIRFVALNKLNLNNKEMAGILGISTDAVRMNRHRLKKKLNLTEEDDLEKLIETI